MGSILLDLSFEKEKQIPLYLSVRERRLILPHAPCSHIFFFSYFLHTGKYAYALQWVIIKQIKKG